jgi:hypothetical protein
MGFISPWFVATAAIKAIFDLPAGFMVENL